MITFIVVVHTKLEVFYMKILEKESDSLIILKRDLYIKSQKKGLTHP